MLCGFNLSKSRRNYGHERQIALPSRADRYNFLLLVDPGDLHVRILKCLRKDRKKQFLDQSKYMNGFLHLTFVEQKSCDDDVSGGGDARCDAPREKSTDGCNADKCICCNKQFSIKGVMSKHTLYAKLPKERIYVSVDTWYHEYMKSQMLELLYILRKLGAKTTHLTLEKRFDEASSMEADASLGNMIPHLAADVGIKHNRVKESKNLIDFDATYDSEGFTPYKTMEEFQMDSNIFYLSQSQDWQDIILQRIHCNVVQLKFTFNISDTVKVNNTFYTKLQKMGVNVSNSISASGSLSVNGVVSFE